jgi:ribonuclease HII
MFYCAETDVLEIGVDEAGRGPMFGRVYSAAVILPKDPALFQHALMKDSKKFHSPKKIQAAAEYIKKNAVAWAVAYSSEQTIDALNIRVATHEAMHKAIQQATAQVQAIAASQATAQVQATAASQATAAILLLIDGNDFTKYEDLSHVCIEGGDDKYASISAASILAKVSRDAYIADLCASDPSLIEKYDLLKNKGYGTKKHMDGIKQYGITPFHRRSFGICREYL